jgi:hypothetical protein
MDVSYIISRRHDLSSFLIEPNISYNTSNPAGRKWSSKDNHFFISVFFISPIDIFYMLWSNQSHHTIYCIKEPSQSDHQGDKPNEKKHFYI